MSVNLTPPPPPRRVWRPPPPPPRRWRSPPSPDDWTWYPYPWPPPPTNKSPTSPGKVIVGVAIGVGATLIVLSFVCAICQKLRPSQPNPAAARVAAATVPPRAPPSVFLQPGSDDDDEYCGRQRTRSTAGLPSFTYSPSLKKNLTGSEEEAAACAVCLGEFGVGEMVRLLPACLHLYHAECIDPWLDAHSSCPICRSRTDPATEPDRLPPV